MPPPPSIVAINHVYSSMNQVIRLLRSYQRLELDYLCGKATPRFPPPNQIITRMSGSETIALVPGLFGRWASIVWMADKEYILY